MAGFVFYDAFVNIEYIEAYFLLSFLPSFILMLFFAKLGIFRIQQELSKSKFNLILFKR